MKQKPNWLIQPEDLNTKLAAGDSQLVDVRGKEAFSQKSISGAKNIPLASLDVDAKSQLDTSKEVVVYCACGITSLEAAVRLKEMGFKKVLSLEGGISRWSDVYGK